MKNLKDTILEKLNIKDIKHQYNYYPKTYSQLKELINKLIGERGDIADLNDINTSDMSFLFYNSDFNGDISKWDVSNVTDMHDMFRYTKFTGENGDISKWNVSNVTNMSYMFYGCKNFNADLNNWDVSNVINMRKMFNGCNALKNKPSWYKE